MQERYDGLKKAMKFRSASLLNDSLETYRRSLQDIVDRYHADNDNLLSAYDALAEAQSGDLGVADCRKLYDKLGQGARNSVCGRILQQRITRLAKLSSGKPAPDFTLPTIDNQPFTLSKMSGKSRLSTSGPAGVVLVGSTIRCSNGSMPPIMIRDWRL